MVNRFLAAILVVAAVLLPSQLVRAAEQRVTLTGNTTLTDGRLDGWVQLYDNDGVTLTVVDGPKSLSRVRISAMSNTPNPGIVGIDLQLVSASTEWTTTIQVPQAKAWFEVLPPNMPANYIVVRKAGGSNTLVYEVEAYEELPEPPGPPENLQALATHNSVTLTWQAPLQPVTGYVVYRDGTPIGQVTGTTYTDTSVAPEAEYSYWVVALNQSGASEPGATLSVRTPATPVDPPPAPVAGLQVSPLVEALRVQWKPATDPTVTGYRVYLDGTQILETQETSAELTGLAPGRVYTVAVTAVSDSGESSPVAETGTPLERPTEPPGPVEWPTYTAGAHSVDLRWDPPESGAEEYRIYRDGVLLGITQLPRWTDPTVQPESDYEYTIVAVNALGESEPVTVVVRTRQAGVLDGVGSGGLAGLGAQVSGGLALILPYFLVAAGLLVARTILGTGMRWVGGGRRG